MSNGRSNKNNSTDKIPPVEWIFASLGAAVFLFGFSYMLYTGLSNKNTPPNINISIVSVTSSGSNHVVEISVKNSGSSTAEGLIIEGTLTAGGRQVELSRTTFDYLPEKSFKKGGLIFTRDPSLFELSIRALGYEEP